MTNVDNPDIFSTQHEGDVPSSQNQDLDDSDTTIIYNPDDVVTDKKKRVFTTVTRGIKITKRSRMYTCPKCGIKKTSVQLINEHYKRRHDRVTCKKCDKTFATPNSRDKHMYTHESKKHHVCSQCRKDFPFASMLNDHKGQHTKGKRYPCWWLGCKKGSSYSWDLKKHIRMHRNEKKPNRCTHCNYTNLGPHNLRQHMRTHTDETPHKCKYCGKGFHFGCKRSAIRIHIVKISLKKQSFLHLFHIIVVFFYCVYYCVSYKLRTSLQDTTSVKARNYNHYKKQHMDKFRV